MSHGLFASVQMNDLQALKHCKPPRMRSRECLVVSVEHRVMGSLDALSTFVVKWTEPLASRTGSVRSDGARGHVLVDPFRRHRFTYLRPAAGHVFDRALSTCNPPRPVVIYKVPFYSVGCLCIRLCKSCAVTCICPLADGQRVYSSGERSLHFSLFTALGLRNCM
jgi:hypothetical protein